MGDEFRNTCGYDLPIMCAETPRRCPVCSDHTVESIEGVRLTCQVSTHVLSPFFFISEKSGLQKRLTNLCNAPPFRSGDYLQALLKLGPNLQILAVLPNVLMSHNVGILSNWRMLGAPPVVERN